MPLTATTPPSRRIARASARATSPYVVGWAGATRRSRGPQSGQQTVWAWKRRSAGSAYSAAQAAHIAKPAIVVAGRSYGSPVVIV